MAVKKDQVAEAAEIETVAEAASQVKEASTVKKVSSKTPAEKPEAFCVYIGPSIRGVIQSGTVYPGTREKTLQFLNSAVAQYPLIAPLVVTEKTIAEDRIKVKRAGNLLNVQYKKLVSGVKEEK